MGARYLVGDVFERLAELPDLARDRVGMFLEVDEQEAVA